MDLELALCLDLAMQHPPRKGLEDRRIGHYQVREKCKQGKYVAAFHHNIFPGSSDMWFSETFFFSVNSPVFVFLRQVNFNILQLGRYSNLLSKLCEEAPPFLRFEIPIYLFH